MNKPHKLEDEPKSYGNPKFYKKWANHPNRQFLIRLFAYLEYAEEWE